MSYAVITDYDMLTCLLGSGYDIVEQPKPIVSESILNCIASTCHDDHVNQEQIQFILNMSGYPDEFVKDVIGLVKILDSESAFHINAIVDDFKYNNIDAKEASEKILNHSRMARSKSVPCIEYIPLDYRHQKSSSSLDLHNT